MKKSGIAAIIIFCAVCSAINNPINNPIGNPTVPPSSTGSGLYRSPNPIDTGGNLIMTGNVRGGSEFRGFVPYHSSTDLYTHTGSSDLQSFMRRSAPVTIRSGYSAPQPYYLPSATVTSVNRYGGPTYPSIRENAGTGDYVVPKYFRAQQASGLPAIRLPYEYSIARPLSYNNSADLERLVSYGMMSRQEQRDLAAVLRRAEESKKKTEQVQQADKNILSKAEPLEPAKRSFEPLQPLNSGEKRQMDLAEKTKPGQTVYEQMIRQFGPEKKEKTEDEKAQTAEQFKADSTSPKEPNTGDMRSEISKIDEQTAEAVKGVYKSFAIQSNDRFNSYMKSAEEFLKQGKYYRAADAYTLASIYKPDDPLAYAGRSHALFASGEYMSSAYYLVRAINIFPQYVNIKVDLNAMIPDKDRLESRIADVTKWIDQTSSPELSFLLAYVYYQLDKPEQATRMIGLAAEKMSDNKAVSALKQAIGNN
jgi:tetratricopeptide (TPR) repeat protein